MLPDLLTAVGGVLLGVAAVLVAILGPYGIAALFRRRTPDTGPAAAARSLESNLSELAEALTAAGKRADERDRRVAVLEDRIRNCPIGGCPPRDVLGREQQR